jgi:hypothetical protein
MRNQVKGERLAAARPLLPPPQAGEEGGVRTPSVSAPDRPGAGLLTPSQEVRALRGSPQTTSSTAERPALNRSDRGSNPRWSSSSGIRDQSSGIRKAVRGAGSGF